MALIRPRDLLAFPIQSSDLAPLMRPVYFNGCLGWFHPPAEPASAVGVILCPPLGREARWTYRTMRKLAERLAGTGLATLRFEYPGTGDSADLPAWEEPLAAWRESVHAAADWLRGQTGLDHVAFAGIRFGALLAADVAAARGDVAAVAMLAPVLSGRSYARELRLTAIAGEGQAPGSGLELDGALLPEATLKAVETIELTRLSAPPAPQMLLMDAGERAAAYTRQLGLQGAEATRLPFPGFDELMQVASSNRVPEDALDSVAAWFGELAGAAGQHSGGAPRHLPEEMTLRLPECRERTVLFGPESRLAGVLCEPASGSGTGRAVIIPNSGGDPRAGVGRFAVKLSRQLAAEGVATLRFDFAGLGDSRQDGDSDAHLYETDRADDIHAALDLLEQVGYHHLAATGLSAGAYHLLQAATGEPRLEALMTVNLGTFAWRPGDVPDAAPRGPVRPAGRYKEIFAQRSAWSRMMRGEVDIESATTNMISRFCRRAASLAARCLGRIGVPTKLDAPRRAMLALLERGTRVLMLSGLDDPGLAALEAIFGRGGAALAALPGAEIQIERDIDHTLSRRAMQDKTVRILADFVAATPPAVTPPDGAGSPR